MRYPQLIIREDDGALARALRPIAEQRKWVVREPRRLEACIRLLAAGHPAVLVLKAGRDLVRELTLLERARWLCPEAPALVVSDAESYPLAGLAWHLGAGFVAVGAQGSEALAAIIGGLMERSFRQQRVGSPRQVAAAPPPGFPEDEAGDHDPND